ncbi:MAG: hypothetical protein ABJJ69_21495 [Paracoccaceae bacterium]
MADRAVSDDNSPEGVVDLINDDRWQARLEEARARREIALREKEKDPSAAPKRKLMPWEKEMAADAELSVEPTIQAPDSDRVDFADRVEKVRETVVKDEEEPVQPQTPRIASRSTTIPLPSTFEDLLTDDAFEYDIQEEDLDWVPPPKKRHSAIDEDAPDVIELASRYASTLTAGAASAADVFEEAEAEKAQKPVVVRNHPPALLILGVVALAALPFATPAPPLDRGPAMPAVPTLRLQPALGFTTAMLWRPFETSSTQWQPATTWSLPLSTVYSPNAPVVLTGEPAVLGNPDVGQGSPTFVEPLAELNAPRSAQPPVLDGAAVDRLPGAFSRRPAPRPLQGEPVVSTRVPSRLPAVATGNETSPRVAPSEDNDSTLLDQVTALKTVVFDRAPDIADGALDALRRAEAATVTAMATAAETASGEAAALEPLAPETVLNLTILIPSRADGTVAGQFADDAVGRGHTVASIKGVDVSISSRNLRYFFESDRGEAERLAAAYGAEARSFTWFSPKPARGTVELWLEGRANPPVRVAPVVRRAAPAPTPPAPTPQIVIVRKPEGLLSRLFGGHRAGTATAGGSGGSSEQGFVVTAPQAPTTTGTTGTGTTTGGTDTGTGGTDTGAGTGTGTDTGSGTGTDAGTGTDTGTGTTGTGAGTGGTDTGTGGTGTGTGGTDTSGGTGTSTDTSGGTTGTSGGTSGSDTSSDSGSGSSGGASGGGSTDSSGSSGSSGPSGGGGGSSSDSASSSDP